MSEIDRLWSSASESEWRAAIKSYDTFITNSAIAQLDAEIDPIKPKAIADLSDRQWFEFLHDKYFPWKYTAPNRLATTRKNLRDYRDRKNGLSDLRRIRDRLVNAQVKNIDFTLRLTTEIGGLGVAGASGLLSLMYPKYFGTVDEFLILALAQVRSLPERPKLTELATRINESKSSNKSFAISHRVGLMLIEIMRRKAQENNEVFESKFWTPRQIDKVLWAFGHL